jgi:hypothetical protein
VLIDKLATVVPTSDSPVESEPKPDAVLLDRLVMLAVLLARPVDSDVADCAIPVDKLANAVPAPATLVESEPTLDAALLDRLVTLAVLLESPVDSDDKDCEAVVDSVASPEETAATPVALLAVAVDSDVTD